jgi:hypothetical protein
MSLRLLALLPLLSLLACTGGGETTASAGDGSTGGSTGAPTTGGPACGDGEIGEGELCDGAALGDKQCADLDPSLAGSLACTADCAAFDMSGCTVDPNAPKVVFNEVTSRGVLDGPVIGDAIELYNAGGGPADLAGWKLSDDPTFPADKTYVFPPGSQLAAGAYLVLVTRDDVTSVGDFPFGISDSKQETLTLAGAAGTTLDELIVDGPDAVASYCRLPDGTGAWQRCDPTFGAVNVAASATCGDGVREADEACDGTDLADNTCTGLGFAGGALACSTACGLDAAACESDSLVVLNEVETGEDAIELYNAGAEPIDLSGWILTDEPITPDYDLGADLERHEFPENTMIEPGEFLVIAKGDLPDQPRFGLANAGDAVTLRAPDLTPRSHVAFGPDQAVLSYCRVPDGPGGVWYADCAPTFGAANDKPMP